MIKLWLVTAALPAGAALLGAPLLVGCGGSSPEPAEPSVAEPSHSQPAQEGWETEPAVGAEPSNTASDDAVGSQPQEAPLGGAKKETRTTEVIRDVVTQNRDSVRRCFDDLSTEEKGTGGMLTIAFQLSSKGVVQDASLNAERSTLKQPKLVNCAIAAIKAMKFPPSSRGFESSVNYPFNFRP